MTNKQMKEGNSLQKYGVNKSGNRFNSFYFKEDTGALFLPATDKEAFLALYDGPEAVVDDEEVFLDINWFKKEYPLDEWIVIEDLIKAKIQNILE